MKKHIDKIIIGIAVIGLGIYFRKDIKKLFSKKESNSGQGSDTETNTNGTSTTGTSLPKPESTTPTQSTTTIKKYLIATAKGIHEVFAEANDMGFAWQRNGFTKKGEKFFVGNAGKLSNNRYFIYSEKLKGWINKESVTLAYEQLQTKATL